MHWRHLTDRTTKFLKDGFDLRERDIDWPALDYFAFGIAGTGLDAEMDHRLIRLVRIKQILRELGRLAKAEWQQTGGKRIERTGVTRLLRIQQPFCFCECLSTTHADGLIE